MRGLLPRPARKRAGQHYEARLRGLGGRFSERRHAVYKHTFEREENPVTSYTALYVHCVWSTWDRLPLIDNAAEAAIYPALAAKCHELRCESVAIGGVADHVHALVRFIPTMTIARLIGEMKGASSHLMTHSIRPGAFFKWQRAYSAFTVSQRAVPQVEEYVRVQKQRHRAGSLLAELEP
jgi:REP element-mobilizing transposase RayT